MKVEVQCMRYFIQIVGEVLPSGLRKLNLCMVMDCMAFTVDLEYTVTKICVLISGLDLELMFQNLK